MVPGTGEGERKDRTRRNDASCPCTAFVPGIAVVGGVAVGPGVAVVRGVTGGGRLCPEPVTTLISVRIADANEDPSGDQAIDVPSRPGQVRVTRSASAVTHLL